MDENKKKKEEYYAIVSRPSDYDNRKAAEYNPMNYLSTWDFIVVFLALLLRFLVEINLKAIKIEKDKGEQFDFFKYFDFKHGIRWGMHLISCSLGIIILPEIFVLYVSKEYEIGLTDWALLGSGIVGFVGYDIVRISEKIFLGVLSKIVGYKPD